MKPLPAHLPPLPENAVYLGLGNSFKFVSFDFEGWCSDPRCDSAWDDNGPWGGIEENWHYAAPKDSPIALLNGEPEIERLRGLDIIRDFSSLQAECDALGNSNVLLAQKISRLKTDYASVEAVKIKLEEALRRLSNICHQHDIYPLISGHVALAEAALKASEELSND